jgi:hypothetical protein
MGIGAVERQNPQNIIFRNGVEPGWGAPRSVGGAEALLRTASVAAPTLAYFG